MITESNVMRVFFFFILKVFDTCGKNCFLGHLYQFVISSAMNENSGVFCYSLLNSYQTCLHVATETL